MSDSFQRSSEHIVCVVALQRDAHCDRRDAMFKKAILLLAASTFVPCVAEAASAKKKRVSCVSEAGAEAASINCKPEAASAKKKRATNSSSAAQTRKTNSAGGSTPPSDPGTSPSVDPTDKGRHSTDSWQERGQTLS